MRQELAGAQSVGKLAVEKETWGICTRRAGKLNKARYRLYRSQMLQVNMRWKALAEIYTLHSFAQLLESIFHNRKLGKIEPGQTSLHRFLISKVSF